MKKIAVMAVAALGSAAMMLVGLPSSAAQDRGEAQQRVERQLEPLHRMQVLDLQDMEQEPDDVQVRVAGAGSSWLGIETREVSADSVKQLKLPAERGVVVGRIAPDSPAAKAGLKQNDVITEVNGQPLEGTGQLRRMIREIPAGRTAQLGIWRDGKAQTVSVMMEKTEVEHRAWGSGMEPGGFAFQMPKLPELPEVMEIPDVPDMDFSDGNVLIQGGRPRLGIDAEDVRGQLGAFLGAPSDGGVLVRSVNAGSVAEKAGVKAGDVITSFNGEAIHSLGDLREKLGAKSDDKPAQLGVVRNKSAQTLSVTLPAGQPKAMRKLGHTTNL
jgi:C-terminal processing protease CtpA/Prc